MATVNTETLKVRITASTDAEVLGLVSGEDDLTVVDESTAGWVGVSTADGTGYVSTDYVTLDTEFTYAESKEEEAARLAKEEAERKAAEEAARKAEEKARKAEEAKQPRQQQRSHLSLQANHQAVLHQRRAIAHQVVQTDRLLLIMHHSSLAILMFTVAQVLQTEQIVQDL